MDVKELRIGNLIQYNGIECKPLIINGDGIVHVLGVDFFDFFHSSKLNPIPLTEDILLRFGFWRDADHYYQIGYSLWMLNDSMFCCDRNGIVVKFAHQLQNLYFSITNEELNTNK